MLKKEYDVAIIGGGMSGLMLAYKLMNSKPELNIVILEKGRSLKKRFCPIIEGKVNHCIGCDPCSIMTGLAGAGAFSDGKFTITNEFGGWLSEFIGLESSLAYMELADEILVSLGATEYRYKPDNGLKKECLENRLFMKQGDIKHLGTEKTYEIMMNLIDAIREKCEVVSDMEVIDVDKDKRIIKTKDNQEVYADNIIFAVGRSGSSFLTDWCNKNKISLSVNPVDLGVRVEMPSLIWKDISNKVYDPKISYRSDQYGDHTRMFCFNDGGNVVSENTNGIITVNGHAYSDPDRKTENSNFALLSSIKFSEEFINPTQYIENVSKTANLIGGGNVVVQRFGDLLEGKRTTKSRLSESTVRPTLDAAPGDLSLCIPKRQLDNIIETIHQLDKIAPGTANYDTLLYGVECKYYSSRPKTKNFELENCDSIYACGDGAGITRSLAQAAANGLYIADMLAKKY
ncbi:MAG: FAD-dependent oxidoreductase [Erysipelothrix sp.]|nr:FAD-dependent oxidoreductase [Erysipelothrix sp.]